MQKIKISILLTMLILAFSCNKTPTQPSPQPSTTVPAAPSNLQATVISDTEIRLTWQDNSNNEDGFRIEYTEAYFDQNENWIKIVDITAGSIEYIYSVDKELYTFRYRVASYNSKGVSQYSGSYYLPTPKPDIAVANLTVNQYSRYDWINGTPFDISFTIRNYSCQLINTFTIKAYISNDNTIDSGDIEIANKVSSYETDREEEGLDWAPFDYESFDDIIPPVELNGEFYIIVKIEPYGNVNEHKDNNNIIVTPNKVRISGYTQSEMVSIPGGLFQMGDSFNEGDSDELPIHNVSINSFKIGTHEVYNLQVWQFLCSEYKNFNIALNDTGYYIEDKSTQKILYTTDNVVNSMKLPHFINYDDLNDTFLLDLSLSSEFNASQVTWYGAVRYCNWLSEKEGYEKAYDSIYNLNISKNGYRLPTEAEWEYAARGGLVGQRYPWGDSIDENKAHYNPNDSRDFLIINGGDFLQNNFMLYNIVGKMYEWCNDWYDENYYNLSPSSNPKGPYTGIDKVIRGGAWLSKADELRCAARMHIAPYNGRIVMGFRLARSN